MMKKILIRGLHKGLRVTWTLSKVIFPITLLITLLQYTPVLPFFIDMIEPLMSGIGLPGEASVPLVLGFSLNLYAGIAAIISFEFTVKQVFILAVMLSFAHNLFVESTVSVKVGVRWYIVILIRLSLALISALLIHHFVSFEQTLAQYAFEEVQEETVSGVINVMIHAFTTAFDSVWGLAMIVVPLMVAMQLFRDLGWLDVLTEWLSPFTRLLGIKSNAAMTLVAGLTIGLAFGAGVMVEAIKDDHVEKKDMYLSFIFLISCHAVVEDTLIFVPLGIPILPLFFIRLLTAVILTRIVSIIWTRFETNKQNI
jgi:hypothetical protein